MSKTSPVMRHVGIGLAFALGLSACDNVTVNSRTSCRADAQKIDCEGSIGSVRGQHSLKLGEAALSRLMQLEATLSAEEGTMKVSITGPEGDQTQVLTPQSPVTLAGPIVSNEIVVKVTEGPVRNLQWQATLRSAD